MYDILRPVHMHSLTGTKCSHGNVQVHNVMHLHFMHSMHSCTHSCWGKSSNGDVVRAFWCITHSLTRCSRLHLKLSHAYSLDAAFCGAYKLSHVTGMWTVHCASHVVLSVPLSQLTWPVTSSSKVL